MALAFLSGCATVMSHGPGQGASADAQRLSHKSLQQGLAPFRALMPGHEVSVRIRGEGPGGCPRPLEIYAADILREMAAASGGRYVGTEGGEVRLEIWSAQSAMTTTERNLVVTAQNVRVPLFYGEGFTGTSDFIVLARDGNDRLIPRRAQPGVQGETEYYLFRIIGPFRR